MSDVIYMDVGQGREQDAQALETRCKRCAQLLPGSKKTQSSCEKVMGSTLMRVAASDPDRVHSKRSFGNQLCKSFAQHCVELLRSLDVREVSLAVDHS
jgi:hypothetical protein